MKAPRKRNKALPARRESGPLKWMPYDPSWLVELAKLQFPELEWLAKSLATCTKYAVESRAYYYFIDPADPNEPGSQWQFRENITLEDKKLGDIVVDVLTDNRIGGIEFWKYI